MKKEDFALSKVKDGVYDVVLKKHYLSRVHIEYFGCNFLVIQKMNKDIMTIKISENKIKHVLDTYTSHKVNAITGKWMALIRVIENEIVDYFPFKCEQ